MELSRDETSTGYVEELRRFEALIRGLDDAAWTTPTRCEGWAVADVAAHVTGTLADITQGRLDGLGTPEVTAREVDERRGRTATELADELDGVIKAGTDLLALFDDSAWSAPAPGGYDGTLGSAVEALWFDTYIHGDDIRNALGQPSVSSPAMKASVKHVAEMLERDGWGPAVIAVDGYEEIAVGGGGDAAARVAGDPLQFVLVATGRADPTTLGLDETVNIYRS